jgi:antitoxin component YwqK of YwqJK toxin-antitoxin module
VRTLLVEGGLVNKTLLFVLALATAGCAGPIPRDLDDLSRQGPQYLEPETLEPYSGPAYRMSEYDSTRIVLRINLRDGRFHGDFEDFEPEGDTLGLYQTGTYRDGQLEGRYEYFYPSGVLRGRGTYENGLEEGPYESYHANGELRSKINYTDGALDGPYEFYHENGQLWQKVTYVADERDGPFERYYENGQLWQKSTYVADEYDGPAELYHENGQLWQRGALNMGEACGEWIIEGEAETYPPC